MDSVEIDINKRRNKELMINHFDPDSFKVCAFGSMVS